MSDLDLVPLSVFPFFSFSLPIYKKTTALFHTKKYKIPELQRYLDEERFADVYSAYDEEALYLHVDARSEVGVDTNYRKGDCLELFLHTKKDDTRTFMTQFCHHLVFFPEPVDGKLVKEVTKFRTEEVHPLLTEEDLEVQSKVEPGRYFLDIAIPYAALHGFTPEKKQLRLFYRINRKTGLSQSLSMSSLEYDPQKVPHAWPEVEFISSFK